MCDSTKGGRPKYCPQTLPAFRKHQQAFSQAFVSHKAPLDKTAIQLYVCWSFVILVLVKEIYDADLMKFWRRLIDLEKVQDWEEAFELQQLMDNGENGRSDYRLDKDNYLSPYKPPKCKRRKGIIILFSKATRVRGSFLFQRGIRSTSTKKRGGGSPVRGISLFKNIEKELYCKRK